jgi:hypothetical protein
MNAALFLRDSRMSAEDLQELTAALLRSIRQKTDLAARLPEEHGGAGAKGDAVTIGYIVLANSLTILDLFPGGGGVLRGLNL